MFEKAVKPLVQKFVSGKSVSLLVAGPDCKKNSKLMYRVNPEGLLMYAHACATELIGLLVKGGKLSKKGLSLKVKGFNIHEGRKFDVFCLNPFEEAGSKQKTLKVDSSSNMAEFCRICKGSDTIHKALKPDSEVESTLLQTVVLTLESTGSE